MTQQSTWRVPGNTTRSVGLQRLFSHVRSLSRAIRRMQISAHPPNVPPHLRRDVGLLNEHRMPDWWDLK